MTTNQPTHLTRRDLLRLGLSVSPLFLAACVPPSPRQTPATDATANKPTPAAVQALSPTPACGDDDEPTPEQTAGPYYTPNTPERTSLLEAGISGTKLVVSGAVLSTGCQPIARALLDFWHCDADGVYDNAGYKLRGHQFSDEQGRYTLETIVPGIYPGRTRHIHVMVQAPNQPVLVTQLYFPDEPENAGDGIFDPALIMKLEDGGEGQAANFNFVLPV